MRHNSFKNTITILFISASLTAHFFVPTISAEYSTMDKKNKAKLEKEIQELRVEVKKAKSKLDSESKSERDAYLKNAKGAGKSRSAKFNTGRDYYEATQAKQVGAKNYEKMKEKHEDLKTRLDQLEWELKELKAKEK